MLINNVSIAFRDLQRIDLNSEHRSETFLLKFIFVIKTCRHMVRIMLMVMQF